MAVPVQLYVYDLSHGMARMMSMSLLGIQIDGVWHTGVNVHGREYFFGAGQGENNPYATGLRNVGDPNRSGIKYCPPGGTILGQPQQIIDIGTTEIPVEIIDEFLTELASTTFQVSSYNLMQHNCNHFSNELCQFLTGNSIPDHIVNLPNTVMSTPLGPLIQQLMSGSGA